MAFDSLSQKLQNVFKNLRSKGRLTEDDVKAALKEVKMALLEADVNFKVVKQFTKAVQERAIGSDVMNGLNPGQMVIKIVNEEMVKLMGSETTEIALRPGQQITVIMMVGLQGAGKTTTTAKIAGKLKQKGKKPLLAACDVYLPAAIEQLKINGDYLTELLEEEGFQVMHHKGEYDVGDRDHAYSKAAPSIQKIINDNPSIQVVIDLHRDGVGENTRLVTTQNGKKMAKIMFFNGLSRTTASGDIPYLKNPYISDNLAFSFQMQLAAAEYYPDFTRRIYLKGYRFNMHFCPKSMLVEVGAQTNTFEEAKNAMEPLADLFAKVLK